MKKIFKRNRLKVTIDSESKTGTTDGEKSYYGTYRPFFNSFVFANFDRKVRELKARDYVEIA